ncbi:glycoside hydrolase superfamily [Polychytrium aggregatum]|uniref:glycoside hydrolase superfamily n=1 Tax=Polychytrium aggregatum TaxID=110093 RepID=UPI0022FDEC94|nr:glycoside hydrolase superfamily [Polychytrium aggregatum]KAI9199857.1 glycoside hydrolase superfamily [Polychytrium aggregatum]
MSLKSLFAAALLLSSAATFGAAQQTSSTTRCVQPGVGREWVISGTDTIHYCPSGQVCQQNGGDVLCVAKPDNSNFAAAAAKGKKTTTTKGKKTTTTKGKKTKTTKTTTTKSKPTKTPSPPPPPPNGGFNYRKAPSKVGAVAYWPNWSQYSRPENIIDKVDVSKLTVVNYAFFNVDTDGSLMSFDMWGDFRGSDNTKNKDFPAFSTLTDGGIYHLSKARSANSNLRAVVSIGGWSGSVNFSKVAASSTARAAFVKNVHTFLDEYQFDGVDIDWEYPGGGGLGCNSVDPQDAVNFNTLLSQLRTELGSDRIISIAGSGEASRYTVGGTNYLAQYAKSLSYFQVMTYDFYGSWNAYTDFNSPLNFPGSSDPQEPASNGVYDGNKQISISSAITSYISSGVSKNQLVAGIAFYGRSWAVEAGSKAKNNGLYQLCKLPSGTQDSKNPKACPPIPGDSLDAAAPWTDPCGQSYYTGVWMYRNMRKDGVLSNPTTPAGSWKRQYFNFAESPTLFNGTVFISYDDTQSVAAKASWAKSQGLSGVMFWELSEDYNSELYNAATGAFL